MKDDGGKRVSDPIYLATGDFQHVQTDLVIPGRGMDFEIKRFFGQSLDFGGVCRHFLVLAGGEPLRAIRSIILSLA